MVRDDGNDVKFEPGIFEDNVLLEITIPGNSAVTLKTDLKNA